MGASPLSPLRRSRTKSLDALDSSQRFSDVMSGLTQEIAGRAAERSAGPSLGKFLARNFVAGRLASSAASSVDVCQDALQYKFHHATHGQVKMAMYYRDMHAATLDGPRLTLTFRVRRTLRYFGSDYDPDDASHLLSLQLCATADVARLGDLLQTRVAGICCS